MSMIERIYYGSLAIMLILAGPSLLIGTAVAWYFCIDSILYDLRREKDRR